MDILLSMLKGIPEFNSVLQGIEAYSGPVCVTGLGHIHKAHFAAALYRLTGRPLVAVCSDEMAVQRMLQDMSGFLGKAPATIPAREWVFYSASVSRGWEHKRIAALYGAASGEGGLWAVSLDSLIRRCVPKNVLIGAARILEAGQSYDVDGLVRAFVDAGYRRGDQVEGPGQFALRGGILDFYSPAHDLPVRAEFFGDELDSMGFFDPATQRRTENTAKAVLLPCAEVLPQFHPGGGEGLADDIGALIQRLSRRKNPHEKLLDTLREDKTLIENGVAFSAADRYMSLIYPEPGSVLDYFPKNTVFVLCDHNNIAQRAKNHQAEQGQDLDTLLQSGLLAGELCDFSATYEELTSRIARSPTAVFDTFPGSDFGESLAPAQLHNLSVKQLPGYGGSFDTAVADLEMYRKNQFSVMVLCGSRQRAEAFGGLLAGRGIEYRLDLQLRGLPGPGESVLTVGSLTAGIEYPSLRLAVLTEGQLIAPIGRRKAKTRATNRKKLDSFTDLSPGDLVVHEHHGIGRFVGIEQLTVEGVRRDYVKIAYSGSDSLFLPAIQLDLVSKYIGSGEDSPVRLNRLGGDAWNKARARAKAAAKDLAKGLIELYAERQKRRGHAFAPDAPWQAEFEEAFEHEETEDQLRCTVEIKQDMETSVPMDRLLCGDVGFGKTEVALRAVMKCVLDGKQAAILVPTTVLAQQHYVTAVKRFSGFAVKVEVLSRFRTPGQMKKSLREITAGTADLVIGTHRLLQKDIQFKDLGLLIVDEEQRFGVTHKERLKEMSRQVDVLTLSATPIPRTLNMALSGLRDMSTIEEPPQDRHPVQTYVMEYDWTVLSDAIRRELARGGQVYYLHNRVESIERAAARIAAIDEGINVEIAHGQMGEERLSSVMQEMVDGTVNVLVCTTIIETGIDIPNVNTLIIEDADKMGLAQLHQIRGRVGRSSRHAFAYLTFRRGKTLTDIAEKRLSAIREFAEFGSGFKIAMRDLEIRGAGNLLGSEQSGHMISVGYDMYLKLLEEAVLEEKGETPVSTADCSADLIVSAGIPERYVPPAEQRMDLYRRIAAIRADEDAEDLYDEIIDRFGDPPKSVTALVDIALLRARAAEAGIRDISQKSGTLVFTLAVTDFMAISQICADAQFKGRTLFSAGEPPYLTLRLEKGSNPVGQARKFIDKYGSFRRE